MVKTKSTKSTSKSAPTSMEELLAAHSASIKTFSAGDRVRAKLIDSNTRSASFDIGGKSEGVISGPDFEEYSSFLKTFKSGDIVEAIVVEPENKEGMVRLSVRHTVNDAIWTKLESATKKDKPIKVRIKSHSDKGFTVTIDSYLIGFVPASHVGSELWAQEEIDGMTIAVKPIELDPDKNRIVLSERAVSEPEELEREAKALKKVKQGEKYKGKIVQLTKFGAFVEIPVKIGSKTINIEGLVHISEISWEKTAVPQDKLAVGDKVDVFVINTSDGKLALSIKQATSDPWTSAVKKYAPDTKVTGRVVRLSDFGAFVELEPGVEGLLHITKIPPDKILEKGEEIPVVVEEVDEKEHKISLGLVLTSKPVGYK